MDSDARLQQLFKTMFANMEFEWEKTISHIDASYKSFCTPPVDDDGCCEHVSRVYQRNERIDGFPMGSRQKAACMLIELDEAASDCRACREWRDDVLNEVRSLINDTDRSLSDWRKDLINHGSDLMVVKNGGAKRQNSWSRSLFGYSVHHCDGNRCSS